MALIGPAPAEPAVTEKIETYDVTGRTPAEARAGIDYATSPMGGVVQLADFDAENLLVLSRELAYGGLTLSPRAKERL